MPQKPSTAVTRGRLRELEPAGTKVLPARRFRSDFGIQDIRRHLGTGIVAFPLHPIETLTPARTVGQGRTNLTIIEPTIVQVDTTPPAPAFAGFDKTKSQRNPAIQMHYEPGAYGMTLPATYLMEFTIAVNGSATFQLAGGPAGLNISNGGVKTLSGAVRVTLVFNELPPGAQVFGFLEQRSGGSWTWFQTQMKFLPLILNA